MRALFIRTPVSSWLAILATTLAWVASAWILGVIMFGEAGELPGIIGKALAPQFAVNEESAPGKLSFISAKTNELMLIIEWLSTNQSPSFLLNNNHLKTELLANNALASGQARTNVITHLGQVIDKSDFALDGLKGLRLRKDTKGLFGKPGARRRLNFLILEDAARTHLKQERLDKVPIAVFGLAFVVLTLLVIRIACFYRECHALVEFEGSKRTSWRSAKSKYPKQRPAKRIELFNKHPSSNDARECVPEISGLEVAGIHGQYSPIKIGIWVLPVLGFVGTAFGMSKAIGGFSSALGGDANAMTSTLSQIVIPGLASAFYTTIIALLAAVVAHFCATSLHDCELHFVDELDRLCLEKFADVPRPAGGGVSGDRAAAGSLISREEFAEKLKEVEDDLADLRRRLN